MSDKFLDVVTFVEKKGGGKKPVRIGWAKMGDDGKINGAIEGAVNFTFIIEERREQGSRLSVSADRRAPSTSRPAWGTSGHGNSAKHAVGDDGGGDGYGDGTADAYQDANDDVPFISQRDDIRARLR